MADEELSSAFDRRQDINDGEIKPTFNKKIPVATEFKEFSLKEIREYKALFEKWEVKDAEDDGYINLENMKRLMEDIGFPQTHLGLKQMIKEVDDSGTGNIGVHSFFFIFRKGRNGELTEGSGCYDLYRSMNSIDVNKAGVGGAAAFFEAKVKQQHEGSKFAQEIRDEQEERKLEDERRRKRQEKFEAKQNLFESDEKSQTENE